MQHNNEIIIKKSGYVYGGALAILAYHFFCGTLLSQISSPPPPLVFPSIDNTYWMLLLSGLPSFIMKQPVLAALFDIALLSLPFMVFIYPAKKWLNVLFTLCAALYMMLFNLYAGHHFHTLFGMVLITIPFWSNKPERFELLWKSVRFYTLFIFFSAAIWKLTRGAALQPQHFHQILLHQHAQLFYDNPDGLRTGLVRLILETPVFSYCVMLAAVATQASFLVGFFTEKYDRILLALLLLFVVMNYLMMNIVSFELLILGLTLLPDTFWFKESSVIPQTV